VNAVLNMLVGESFESARTKSASVEAGRAFGGVKPKKITRKNHDINKYIYVSVLGIFGNLWRLISSFPFSYSSNSIKLVK
jgi:hypothetical protein